METTLKIIGRDELLAERRKGTHEETIEARVGDRTIEVEKRIVNGEMETLSFDQGAIGELLTTPAAMDTLVTKTVLDLEQGRETVPVLYRPVYRNRTNDGFTKNVEVGRTSSGARAVFLEHVEGEEIRFGTRVFGAKDTVPIITYATGFQWTEDLVVYDTTWEAEEANRAMGEAYNALLNHIHLYPIISYAYAAKNKTAAVAGATDYEADRATFKAAIQHAAVDKNADTGRVRTPTIILSASGNRFRIQEALQRAVIGGTVFEAIGQQLNTLILYDGWSVTVGERTYTYPGVPTTKVYLIDGQDYFHELVKHDLRVDAADGDLSRLIEQQIVARARRGVYAAPANAVEEVTLPV